ncbi:MAG: HlyD family efflux transporter periplasmic adaptor subunit [Phormidesmis sp. RL_2_1]|nr:HlyD family efflux transporter periplasmic adaptor subunit [Phormidesmis sp. RL_2_1]
MPTVNRWVSVGSWFIVLILSGAIAASFFVKYRTTVKAAAIVRPAGDFRVVQATATGTITSIKAVDNTPVQQGEVLAQIDTASLEARGIQLLANLEQGKSRLSQLDAQIIAVDQQLAAEDALTQRAVAAASADYSASLRANQNQQIAADSAVREAQAQLSLLTKEVESFRLLVDSGAISRLQLDEKQAALASANARMTSLQAELNPSPGEVVATQQRIAQTQASGMATMARLQQSKQQLVQQRLEIQEQLETTEQEIAQVNLGFQNAVVRAPISGVLHEITLRNPGQVVSSGETIAKVVPTDASIVIKTMVPIEQINKVDVVCLQRYACRPAHFQNLARLQDALLRFLQMRSPLVKNQRNRALFTAFSSKQTAHILGQTLARNVP